MKKTITTLIAFLTISVSFALAEENTKLCNEYKIAYLQSKVESNIIELKSIMNDNIVEQLKILNKQTIEQTKQNRLIKKMDAEGCEIPE